MKGAHHWNQQIWLQNRYEEWARRFIKDTMHSRCEAWEGQFTSIRVVDDTSTQFEILSYGPFNFFGEANKSDSVFPIVTQMPLDTPFVFSGHIYSVETNIHQKSMPEVLLSIQVLIHLDSLKMSTYNTPQ